METKKVALKYECSDIKAVNHKIVEVLRDLMQKYNLTPKKFMSLYGKNIESLAYLKSVLNEEVEIGFVLMIILRSITSVNIDGIIDSESYHPYFRDESYTAQLTAESQFMPLEAMITLRKQHGISINDVLDGKKSESNSLLFTSKAVVQSCNLEQ